MFVPRGHDEQEDQQNNAPLLGGRENEKTKEPFHLAA
jgi:hypothetical protein